ncbi:XdhC family protein [Alkalilimnicola ehrlichii MLHE-1]|uniref:Uncharacterized protein n=1 Tax=Alkalilimnicola ehrlichii (strain ATCC BAA-1101 / DSM 17681 / MLHE-1) TaxID=187272 RepID=Q0A8C3_ALKEH|nr:XdhC family protein [Alkalilimnicola ehrlichii]ABI56914.1 protein of unknown function DUF182 [Alkalilimnicola ehrlichii MLHE-1]
MEHNSAVLRKLQQLTAAGTPCALVTVVRAVSPTSAKPGEKAVVTAEGAIHGWIGGGCAQPAVLGTVREALADGAARLIRISPGKGDQPQVAGITDFNMACHSGGTLDIFIDPLLPSPVVNLYGSAPVARHLAALAARMDLRVQVLAPGTTLADFPEAAAHHNAFPTPEDWPAPQWAVVATQGRGDRPALEAALQTAADPVAFIASPRKRDKLRDELRGRGVCPSRLQCIRTPAGVPIGARTPAEIALSVVAQLVQWRRGADSTPAAKAGAEDSGVATEPEAAPAARPETPSCCGGGV